MSAAVVKVEADGALAVSIQRPGRGAYSRAGEQRINAGDITVTIAFNTQLPDTNYIPQMNIGNSIDDPNLAPLITAHLYQRTANGFTFRLSNGPLTGNYFAYWTMAEINNP
jgi:hypothetical protein